MINQFLDFLKTSKTAFHATKNVEDILKTNGFIKLNESDDYIIKNEGKYYITRNNSSLIAFKTPKDLDELSFNIVATHLDSPTFKLKPNYKICDGSYLKLNTEIYGGPILNTWMDRPLGIAGRVIVKTNDGLKTMLVDLDRPICMIPNCSIHYYRELNTGVKLNPQIDLIPIASDSLDKDILDLVKEKLNIAKEDIVSQDLYLTNLDRGCIVGINNEFIMAPQIDNLECSFGALNSFLDSNNNLKSINVLALFDNEEIGSLTRQGAGSPLLFDTLSRIINGLGMTNNDLRRILSSSFLVSADNAQGYHPNYQFKYDPTNKVFMNKGIVIKNAARGSYTTDAISLAYFKEICNKANAKYQLNTNRSDVPGGSTLGAVTLGNISISAVDIGLPQIAMHSSYETAGRYDLDELYKALKTFYDTHLKSLADGVLTY